MRITQRVIETSSLEDHVEAIRQQVDASVMDPETRRLAVSLASGNFTWVSDPRFGGAQTPVVHYHGRFYPVAPPSGVPPTCNARDHTCEIVSIWNFVVLNLRYTADTDGFDTYQDLRTSLEAGGGDCDDYTIAFCALLRSLGYSCAARIISLDGRSWAHVYVLVQHPEQGWIALDATEEGKKPGWEFRGAKQQRDFAMGELD